MPFAKQSLAADLEYTAWANQRVLDACAKLSLEEITRDLGISHRSILDTLFHNYDGERFWLEGLFAGVISFIGDEETTKPSTLPEETLRSMQQRWPQLSRDMLDWFALQSAETLAENISITFPNRNTRPMPRWQVLRHMANHATQHRGQILATMRMLGHQPPSTDLIGYFLK